MILSKLDVPETGFQMLAHHLSSSWEYNSFLKLLSQREVPTEDPNDSMMTVKSLSFLSFRYREGSSLKSPTPFPRGLGPLLPRSTLLSLKGPEEASNVPRVGQVLGYDQRRLRQPSRLQ